MLVIVVITVFKSSLQMESSYLHLVQEVLVLDNFEYPEGIAIINNLLYVVELGNHRVSVFSIDGKFIRYFGSRGTNKDKFDNPRGITTDNEGCLYICDKDNKRLVVY